MKNNVLKLIKYLYYCSLVGLLILYLFPGSLLGYLFYGNFSKQPDLIPNPIGTSINHALAFLYLSILGLISCFRDKNFNQTIIFLIFLSIVLELSHYVIPNRSFEFLDLFANLLGTLIAIFIIVFYKKYKKIL
ncbi:VanZ family protein [Pelagibacterales bacterium SAG-MED05]|nr:VanZ family protein [Pelagibacterales bacterium SAG-MED05]